MKMWEQYFFYNLNYFGHIDQTHQIGSVQKRAIHHGPAVNSQWYPPHSCLTESGAARLHIGLIGSLNARLPRHTPIACDGFITLGLWLSVSIRSRLSSLTSHLRYVKPKMLPLTLRVIAHLRAGTAHRPTIGNNVTPDPIFNCQVTV